MAMFKPMKAKKKKGIFAQQQEALGEIDAYQHQQQDPAEQFPNLRGKKPKKKKGWFD